MKIQDSVELQAKLLRRAQTEQLIARRDPDDPHVAWVSSSHIEHHWYCVTRSSCTCPAFEHQGDCKHRVLACYLADNGLMPFHNAGEFVVAGKPTKPAAEPSRESAPKLYEMRQGTRQPRPGTDDERRLAWSYWN
jgi:hypothetical protein